MALPSLSGLWKAAHQLQDLFALHRDVKASLQVIEERLRALEDRMLRLERDQTQLVTEARSAATAAATMIAGAVIADAVTRITRLEGRTEQLEQQRLSPP